MQPLSASETSFGIIYEWILFIKSHLCQRLISDRSAVDTIIKYMSNVICQHYVRHSPVLWHDIVSHVMPGASAYVIRSLVDIYAAQAYFVVVVDGSRHELVGPAVRAGVERATRLRVPTAVGVEVAVSDGEENAKYAPIGVDCLHVLG